jgi:hypothetical protein
VAITDTFGGSDANPIDGNWATMTSLAALRRVSTKCRNAGSDADSGARRTDGTFPDDQYAQVLLDTGTTPDGGPAVRCASAALTMYFCGAHDANAHLHKFVAASYTELASAAATWSTTQVGKLEAIGTSIKFYVAGVERAAATDSAIASGSPGLFLYESALIVDDFECTDITGGATPVGQVAAMALMGVS